MADRSCRTAFSALLPFQGSSRVRGHLFHDAPHRLKLRVALERQDVVRPEAALSNRYLVGDRVSLPAHQVDDRVLDEAACLQDAFRQSIQPVIPAQDEPRHPVVSIGTAHEFLHRLSRREAPPGHRLMQVSRQNMAGLAWVRPDSVQRDRNRHRR